MRIKLALIRHSRSCANHMRELDEALTNASQQLRDPGLTLIGQQMAELYGPVLQQRLVAAGFDTARLVVGASALRRAKETAALLFPAHAVEVMPHLTEHGAIPENTPRSGLGGRNPDWAAFIRYLCNTARAGSDGTCHMAIVGHGGYLRTEVWGALTGRPKARMGNLDVILVEGDLDLAAGRLLHRRVTELPYRERIAGPDRCVVAEDHRHVVRHTRRRRYRNRKTRNRRRR
jgi:broad specificity phosphatase PhoE